jgi:hypothetical protein
MIGILIAHLVGDYVLQNNWMAQRKTSNGYIAALHATLYTGAYAVLLVITYHGLWWGVPLTLYLILATHLYIDRFRPIVWSLIWLLNQLAPRAYRYPWAEAKRNGGYSDKTPAVLSTWLSIIVDNTIHLTINTLAIYLLLGGIS